MLEIVLKRRPIVLKVRTDTCMPVHVATNDGLPPVAAAHDVVDRAKDIRLPVCAARSENYHQSIGSINTNVPRL